MNPMECIQVQPGQDVNITVSEITNNVIIHYENWKKPRKINKVGVYVDKAKIYLDSTEKNHSSWFTMAFSIICHIKLFVYDLY